MATRNVPKAMTVAGSDSGGGAGIQADLKTFGAFGVYGTSAITAITAQNTLGVTAVHELPPDLVAAQIDAIVTDIGADAVKTGMLASAPIVQTVAEQIRRHRLANVVVDPVMVAASGDRLLREDAVETYTTLLFPLATIVTPNIPEAEALAGMSIGGLDDMREAARRIRAFGPRHVLVKGGHMQGDRVTDVLFDGSGFRDFTAERVVTENSHGTGCTLSSAITSGLAHGRSVEDSVGIARRYMTEALRNAYQVGRGHGPVNHFYAWWAAGGGKGLGR